MSNKSSRKLLSFLGRGPYDPVDRSRSEYRETRYKFSMPEGNWLSSKHSIIALAAIEAWKNRGKHNFNSVVVFGTSGSMWDNLLLSVFSQYQLDIPEEIYALESQIDEMTVTAEMVEPFAEMLSASTDLHFDFRVITDATTKDKQADLLQQIDGSVQNNDEVVLDVTHGYRHLPILGLAAAKLISATKNAKIHDVIYGALDQQVNGETPVVSLHWVLRLLDVISSIDEMDRRHNIQPLVKCFSAGSLQNQLELVSYQLDVMRIDEASKSARRCQDMLKADQEKLPAELAIVSDMLSERLGKFTKVGRNPLDLLHMATLALEEKNYLRSSIFIAEAIELAKKWEIPGDETADQQLKDVRNWMAHAGKQRNRNQAVKTAVASRKALGHFLQEHISRIRREVRASKDD